MSAPVVHHLQNRVMRRFHQRQAVGATNAKSLQDVGQRRSLVFRYLVRRGVIVQNGSGLFYLDPESEADFRRRRFRFVLIVLGAGLIALAVVALVVLLQGSM